MKQPGGGAGHVSVDTLCETSLGSLAGVWNTLRLYNMDLF